MRKEIEVPSIIDRDLLPVLTHFGIDQDIENGDVTCGNCFRIITFDNIGALLVESDGISLYCDFSECLDIASRRRG